MRRFLTYLACAAALGAQSASVSVSSPSPNQVLSGFNGFSFMVALTSAPSVSRVCYTVDAYPALNPGFGALMTLGCSITPPFSMPWNSFWVGNGPHQVIATAYNALGVMAAVSPAVPYTVANNWPVSYTPNLAIATGTPTSSNWSGQVSVQATISGSGAGNSKTVWWYIDGIPQQKELNKTAASLTALMDTTQFTNGTHVIAVVVVDNAGGTTYSGDNDYEGLAGEWSANVTFANGAAAMEVRNNARDIYLAPGGTFTLGCTVVNTDGSVAGSSTCDYRSLNTAAATVNGAGVVTAVANGNAQLQTMSELVTGCADLVMSNSLTSVVWSAGCYVFKNSDIGRVIKVTAGSGWTPGLYSIASVDPDTHPTQATLDGQPGVLGSTGGSFALGASRTAWVFVWPTNTMPHFGTDGTILTSYDPNKSLFVHEIFNSGDGATDQQYISPANPFASSGYVGDLNASAFNAVEVGMPYTTLDNFTSGQMSNFQNGQNAYIANVAAGLSGYTKYLWGTGDNFVRAPSNLYATTRGPASQWATPALTYVFSAWKNNSTIPMLGVAMLDEFPYTRHPLQGPITFGVTTQSWLSSLVAAGGTCTVNGVNIDVGQNYFVISGSSIANLSSVNGANYHANSVTGSSFTFSCPGVPDGTYNSSNDPGLTIEPLTANYVNNGDYVHYDAFAKVMTQANSVPGRALMSWPPPAGTTCAQTTNVLGNGIQSIGGITQISDYEDLYTSHVNENYLPSREQSNSVTGLQNFLGVGYWIRARYGCFSPSKPITVISQGTPHQRGLQGFSVPVSSLAGNTITTSAPHGVTNILPGNTRLWLTGMSNPADNGDYFILSAPTATTLTVGLAATSFTCTGACATGTTGTLTFQNGDALTLSSISASGVNDGIGGTTSFAYTGSSTDTVNRHRGQTFTLNVSGGTQSAAYNGNSFIYLTENLIHATDLNGSPASFANYYRQIPNGSSASGTANIVLDNSFVAGRNGRQILGNYTTPGLAFGTLIECAVVRCVGDRLYKWGSTSNGYMDHVVGSSNGGLWIKGGYRGQNLISSFWRKFDDNTVNNQLFANPHFEDGLSVPVWHANNMAALMLTRLQKFLLQPALNSPDYGPLISCGARSGTTGALLFCWNASDGPQTRVYKLAPYLQTGQAITRYIANWQGITMSSLNVGTTTDTVALQPDDAVFYSFPTAATTELAQPTIAVRLADVANATKIAVRFGYDLYWLDAPTNTVFDCGTGTCVPPWDRNIGPVYYRLIYLGLNSEVLATSDVQIL